mgnify:CR=1 FL=1
MNSSVPYLIKAMKEWIQDNGFTPYLVISADSTNVEVPMEHVKDGKIVLNISPSAVRDFYAGEQGLGFSGRFSGVAREVFSPLDAVDGIFAKENGRGMWFSDQPEPNPSGPNKGGAIKPKLKLVK